MATATLETLIARPHFSERHSRRIAAPPEAVWDALQEVRLGDLRISRTLMGVRTLPGRLLGAPTPRMVSGRFLEEGPLPVLASDPPRSVVAGGVMQPWKVFGGKRPPGLDAAALVAFGDSGWVKVGMDFGLDAEGETTTLRTETRVEATDTRTRVLFGAYWALIRIGSGLIRADLLRAVAQRAESAAR